MAGAPQRDDELPTGAVALVLTDIEDSTRLLVALGERYAVALAEHRRIVRAAFADHGGVEVDTQGDAFLFAFRETAGAMRGTAAAQRALSPHPWPDGREVRVRMGMHTGRPERTAEGYVGLDLHRAARIMSAAHGAQVLVSNGSAETVGAAALEGLRLQYLGEHRLKGLAHPERLYQLGGEGLRADFPPPRTLGSHFTNLSAPPPQLVGREPELAELATLLRGGRRLVTLTGPGGTGKTSLALALAHRVLADFPGGMFACELAHVADSGLVPAAIAGVLGLREQAHEGAEAAVAAYLRERRMLLVLDNLEQVIDAGPGIGRLVAACPDLAVLATSRAPLRVRDELEWPVPLLSHSDGATLLAERAAAGDGARALDEGGGPEIALAICARLDGLPLAIELAAARLRVMTPQTLLDRLERRLPVLTGGARDAPERQRTLAATIAWSHDLLGPRERAAFARCAAFTGAFTIEAAEAVCDADIDDLEALVEQSLVVRTGERLRMLETLRGFALERLAERGESEAVRDRHAEEVAAAVDRLGLDFHRGDQSAAVTEAEAELDNVRGALGWLLERGRREDALAVSTALSLLWEMGHRSEGLAWLRRALAGEGPVRDEVRARALLAAGNLSYLQGAREEAQPLFAEATGLFRGLGDPTGEARALGRLMWTANDRGDDDAAGDLRDALIRLLPRITDPPMRADVLRFAAVGDARRLDEAPALLEEERAIWESLGSARRLSECLNNIAWVAMELGDLAEARRRLEQATDLARDAGDRFSLAVVLGNRGVLAAEEGDLADAGRLTGETLALWGGNGDRRVAAESVVLAAAVIAARLPADAVRLAAAAAAAGGLDEVHDRLVARHVSPVAMTLPPDVADGLRREGAETSLDQAVAEAVEALVAVDRGG